MEFSVQWRLKGDGYGDAFGNGFTLSDGESVMGMKKISQDAEKTVYRGKQGHLITCFHKEENGVIALKTLFENKTDRAAALELLSSFSVRGIKADRIHRATSYWSAEGKLLSQDLTDLNMEPSWANHGIRIEKFGQIGSMPVRKWFPFLVLEDSENSDFIGVQLYCPSSWQIEIRTKDRSVTVDGGLADRDFGQWTKEIAPHESFETPKAVIATGKSLYQVCDKLVKYQRPDIAPIDRDMPIVFNEYCFSWGNPTLGNIRKAAEKLKGAGVRYFVIDCGWYKAPCADWFGAAGDWIPDPTLFPNGIREAADIISANGMVPGIWFEFENVGSDAEGFQDVQHLLSRDGFPVTVGRRRFRDMRKAETIKFLDERVIAFLKKNGFGYIKVDYNENIGAGVDGAESYGEGLRQTVQASRDYFVHMKREMPELVIECCSSGGHRLEPSFMETVSMASFSDAHETASIPLIAANLHRLIRPEQSQIWAVVRKDSSLDRIHYLLTSAFLGRLCLSGEIADLSKEQWSAVESGIAFYNEVKHIIKEGVTTLIQTDVKDYSKPRGAQIVLRECGREALLIVHTFENGAKPRLDEILSGYQVKAAYGSDLSGDFQGKAFHLVR